MDFKEAYELPIGNYVEKKGKFSFLSWPYAVKFLRENFPDATWEVKHFDEQPYKFTPAGCFVEVGVKLGEQIFTQIHPVLDNKNAVIKEPNAFQVNTSIQRCLAKAIGIATGIGLGLYAGEDLPVEPPEDIPRLAADQAEEIRGAFGAAEVDDELFKTHFGCEVEEVYAENFNQIMGKIRARIARLEDERG